MHLFHQPLVYRMYASGYPLKYHMYVDYYPCAWLSPKVPQVPALLSPCCSSIHQVRNPLTVAYDWGIWSCGCPRSERGRNEHSTREERGAMKAWLTGAIGPSIRFRIIKYLEPHFVPSPAPHRRGTTLSPLAVPPPLAPPPPHWLRSHLSDMELHQVRELIHGPVGFVQIMPPPVHYAAKGFEPSEREERPRHKGNLVLNRVCNGHQM